MNHLLLKPHKQPKIKLKIGKEPKVCEIISEIDSGLFEIWQIRNFNRKGTKGKNILTGKKHVAALKNLIKTARDNQDLK